MIHFTRMSCNPKLPENWILSQTFSRYSRVIVPKVNKLMNFRYLYVLQLSPQLHPTKGPQAPGCLKFSNCCHQIVFAVSVFFSVCVRYGLISHYAVMGLRFWALLYMVIWIALFLHIYVILEFEFFFFFFFFLVDRW